MAKITINLSQKSINDAIKQINDMKKETLRVNDLVAKDLADKTLDKMKEFYSMFPYKSNTDSPSFYVEKTENGYKAVIASASVAYEEFGTGDIGASDGHPWKGNYSLNPYNSGSTIRPADDKSAKYGITSGLYWTYWNGSYHVYTQGIPSGKFMYNSDIWLRDNYKEIIKQKVADALSKH